MAELCRFAKENGFDKAATGHYAEIVFEKSTGRYAVKRAKDEKKDQSYMLWHLTQEQLEMLYFPLADMTKEEIRQEVLKTDFSYLAEKAESQEICFIHDNDYASYIEKEKGKFPEGNFIDKDGNVIGRHKGIIHYTRGQRKGLGIALGAPAYVTEIDPVNNTVTVEKQSDVKNNMLNAFSLNYQSLQPLENEEYKLEVKIRYGAKPMTATVTVEKGVAKAVFDLPVRAVTPGQSAVFYRDDVVAFGGVII